MEVDRGRIPSAEEAHTLVQGQCPEGKKAMRRRPRTGPVEVVLGYTGTETEELAVNRQREEARRTRSIPAAGTTAGRLRVQMDHGRMDSPVDLDLASRDSVGRIGYDRRILGGYGAAQYHLEEKGDLALLLILVGGIIGYICVT